MKEELREQLLDKLQSVRGMNPKSGMTYALEHFSELARVGMGVSRREVTKGTEKSSPFIHSWDTFDRYLGVCKEFVMFCRSQGVNKLHKLHYATVDAFLMNKIDKEKVKNTLKVNMCALQKFFSGCNRPDLRDQLASDFPRFKELAQSGGTIHAFDNPERLIEKISNRDELVGRRRQAAVYHRRQDPRGQDHGDSGNHHRHRQGQGRQETGARLLEPP